ncbi:hypothetical protein [Erythrobacter crassostreae]|uniref:DUF4019 domain-containing protein n=1 Tax=Erythrobacter crassostreae TaxID=2828328 RepID=A0A9X1F7G1_9SPHN|nr:hypothetical protein [Erythrobacter crassostrea]MBV7260165.1 hypothetical protein [Erythrobacter crassostrea]
MISRVLLAVFGAFALAACNPMENLEQSEARIAQYEKAYSSGNSDALWRLSGEKLREVTPREDFDNLVTVFSSRLGKIESSERSSFNVNSNNGVTQTVIVMNTEFEQGQGTQTYTFFGNGEDMQLVGWNVDSARLAVTVDDLKAVEDVRGEAAAE